MSYHIHEIFRSLQGEGARKGTVNIFIRFAGCNLRCSRATGEGFDCDTEPTRSNVSFNSAERLALAALHEAPPEYQPQPWVVLTGGEPTLQIDIDLLSALRSHGFGVALETNGTRPLGGRATWINYVACSPKPGHELKIERVDELRYVIEAGHELPRVVPFRGVPLYVSPAFGPDNKLNRENLEWCIRLCLANPAWSLSVQDHKLWGVP